MYTLRSKSLARGAAPLSRALATSATQKVPMSVHEQDKFVKYDWMQKNLDVVRKHISGPLTLTEKIVYGHLDNANDAKSIVRGKSYLKLRPGMECLAAGSMREDSNPVVTESG